MLDINLGLILLTAVIFFILVYLLNNWLYKPLLTFMEEREETIRRDMENATANESGAQEILQEAEKIVNEAKHKANLRKKEAIERAKSEGAALIESKKEELEKRYQEFLKELEREEAEIREKLVSQAPLFKEALRAKLNKL
ncbi:MAG: F0F1 ATP synthase subunit B' [Epsilonproteobacteria bacterium]|nr:F0F1 ATP synthase subunit B' [Campylobacterota bacterium]NPA56672.1 F0F1 ATP synthase subunit B' [Campylobacterota bacterium]